MTDGAMPRPEIHRLVLRYTHTMSTRLQVVLDEAELAEIREAAVRHGMNTSEWVRQALRRARRDDATGDAERKMAAVATAVRHEYPTADINEMLLDIEHGYRSV